MTPNELKTLRDDDLLHLARNQSAVQRMDAIRLLVERGSPHAMHPEIARQSTEIIHNEPKILGQIDPATSSRAAKLPGVLDVVSRHGQRVGELEARAGNLEACHTAMSASLHEERDARKSSVQNLSERVDSEHKDIRATAKSDRLSAQVATREEAKTRADETNRLADDFAKRLSEVRRQFEKDKRSLLDRIELIERPWYIKIRDWFRK